MVLTMHALQCYSLTLLMTGCDGQVGKTQASYVEGRKFESQPTQTDDMQNWYSLLPNLALWISRIGQGLVNSITIRWVSRKLGHGASSLISQQGSTIKSSQVGTHPDLRCCHDIKPQPTYKRPVACQMWSNLYQSDQSNTNHNHIFVSLIFYLFKYIHI